jgi:DNA-binding PadR family transcriptional regulator
MGTQNLISEREEYVLLAIIATQPHASGKTILEAIAAVKGFNVQRTQLYDCLAALEEQKLVKGFDVPPTPQRSGRPSRFFEVTASGLLALDEKEFSRTFLRLGTHQPWQKRIA